MFDNGTDNDDLDDEFETCPIARLVEDLVRHGRPSDMWMTCWSRPSGDPLRAAWSVATDPMAMAELLAFSRRDAEPELLATVIALVSGWPKGRKGPARKCLARRLRPWAPSLRLDAELESDERPSTVLWSSYEVGHLVDDLQVYGRPSLRWIVYGALEGDDPVSHWTTDCHLAAWLLAITRPNELMERLVVLREDIHNFEVAAETGQRKEFYGAEDVTEQCRERHGRLVEAMDECMAVDLENEEKLLEHLANVFDIAKPGRPGSDTFWEFASDLFREKPHPSLREVIDAVLRDWKRSLG